MRRTIAEFTASVMAANRAPGLAALELIAPRTSCACLIASSDLISGPTGENSFDAPPVSFSFSDGGTTDVSGRSGSVRPSAPPARAQISSICASLRPAALSSFWVRWSNSAAVGSSGTSCGSRAIEPGLVRRFSPTCPAVDPRT